MPSMNGGGMPPERFGLHSALTAWDFGPFTLCVLAVLVTVAVWYLRADWHLAARGRRWPARRTLSFLLGLLTIEIAVQSPVATFTGSYFQAHVVQHLLLMIVAPPLLALGAPSTLLLQTAPRRTKVRWLAVLRSRPFAVLTHPVTVWALYFGVMFWFFLTSVINVAMHDMALMDLFNVLFFFGGTLYWWPMVGIDPIVHWKMGYGARMANILVGAAPETFLGIAILSQKSPIASMYSLASTHAGGGLLWTSTEMATLIGFIPIFVQWMHSEERLAVRVDAASRASAATASAATAATAAAADGAAGPAGPAPTTGAPQSGDRPLTLWEATWLARRGSVPVALAEPPNPE